MKILITGADTPALLEQALDFAAQRVAPLAEAGPTQSLLPDLEKVMGLLAFAPGTTLPDDLAALVGPHARLQLQTIVNERLLAYYGLLRTAQSGIQAMVHKVHWLEEKLQLPSDKTEASSGCVAVGSPISGSC